MFHGIAHRKLSALAFVGVLSLGACSAGAATDSAAPAGPTGGWLTLQLTTPRTDDGAVQLSVSGPQVDSVKLAGYDGFDTNNGTQVDLVATGNITSGNIALIYVPDLSRTGEYHASVSAAASRDSYSLQTIDGYRAVLVR
jgi:hypothetical protein